MGLFLFSCILVALPPGVVNHSCDESLQALITSFHVGTTTVDHVHPRLPGVIDVVAVAIRRNDEILLGRRASRPDDPVANLWTTWTGKLNDGETLAEAARREVKEEIDLEIGELRFITAYTNQLANGKIYRVFLVEARTFRGIPRIMEPDKMPEMRWFTTQTLPAQRTNEIDFALKSR